MNSIVHRFRLMCCAVVGGIMLLAAVRAGAVEPYPIGKTSIIVDTRIYYGIQTELNNYINTLVSVEGVSPNNIMLNTEFDKNSSIYSVRNRLQEYYTNGIEGAILIGAIPIPTTEWATFDEDGNITGHWQNAADFFYMDLTDKTGQPWTGKDPWIDDSTVSPWVENSFESHSHGGGTYGEIWVSRIMSHNFTEFRRLGEAQLRDPSHEINSEILVINDYLQRARNRMTAPASIPRRGFLMADSEDPSIKNAFTFNYDNLQLPYFNKIGYPDDKAVNWKNRLQDAGDIGWEWAVIGEHSCPTHSVFQQNHEPHDPNAGTFGSAGRWTPPYYSYVDMTLNGGAPSQTLFYDSHGCENANILDSNCLVQMYAMGHHGLIGMGASIGFYPKERKTYYTSLGNGQTFGKSFLQWLNSGEPYDYTSNIELIGAGTLRAREYIPYPTPQIHIDDILHSYHFKERPLRWEAGSYISAFFASISCPSSSFLPELAAYNWDLGGSAYSVNPINGYVISDANFEKYKNSIEISAPNFLSTNATFGFSLLYYLDPVLPVGTVGGSYGTNDFKIFGCPNGPGSIHADDSYDQADNFLYVTLNEPANTIKSLTSQPTENTVIPEINPSMESPGWGENWGVDGNNYQSGIMVRVMNAEGGTDANAPYVCIYQELDQTEHSTVFFQYRDYAGDHAHKQVIARYSTSPNSMDWKLILERQGTQILAFVRDESGQKTPVGVPKAFDFSQCKWMLFVAGKSNNMWFQVFPLSKTTTYEINYSLLSLKENGVLKADVTDGTSGSLYVLGAEQTGGLSGLKFSNSASITSGGNVVRAASLYNKKTWLDNAANLSGGLIFRDPDGRPIVHISTGGTISVRGGILPNMVTD